MIRAILTYIKKKAEKSGNKVVQYIACCCVCCFWCLENCLRFINKNAYVQVTVSAILVASPPLGLRFPLPLVLLTLFVTRLASDQFHPPC